jgi:hypothetical protein
MSARIYFGRRARELGGARRTLELKKEKGILRDKMTASSRGTRAAASALRKSHFIKKRIDLTRKRINPLTTTTLHLRILLPALTTLVRSRSSLPQDPRSNT